jgi:hypothetical protein
MNGKIRAFEDLIVWQKSHRLRQAGLLNNGGRRTEARFWS